MARSSTLSAKQRKPLRGLAAFLPVLTDPYFSFGTWQDCFQLAQGHWMMPFFDFSTGAKRFFDATYDLGWVDLAFDWTAWSKTDEAQSLLADHRLIKTATPDQLRRLLTMSVRMDRYCEGSLAGDFESGLHIAIILRACALTKAAEG
jgi:hypothetical protein